MTNHPDWTISTCIVVVTLGVWFSRFKYNCLTSVLSKGEPFQCYQTFDRTASRRKNNVEKRLFHHSPTPLSFMYQKICSEEQNSTRQGLKLLLYTLDKNSQDLLVTLNLMMVGPVTIKDCNKNDLKNTERKARWECFAKDN